MAAERLFGSPRTRWLGIFACAGLLWAGASVVRAAPSERSPDATDQVAPRGTVRGFLEACRVDDFVAAARYLDLGSTDAQGAGLARQFNVVLDQKLWVDLETLSSEPAGDLGDGLPPDLEKLGSIETSRGDVDILLARRDSGDAGPVWRFASTTVSRIPALYDEFGYGVLGEWLPDPLFKVWMFDVRMWQWIGLLLLVVVAFGISWIATAILHRVLRALVAKTGTPVDDLLLEVAVKPFRLVLSAVLFLFGTLALRLAVPVEEFLGSSVRGLIIVAATWLALRLVDGFRDQLRGRLEAQGRLGAVAVIPLAVKTVKVILVVLAGLALLQHLGFNVTGVVAGLGVGGIALALAAQKTIENLLGGATLVADQPVRVGDVCRFGDKTGTVEDIGLRSTRIRTLDRTLISIPNAEFSQSQIENFAERDRIRLACTLGLRYETGPDQLRHVLAGLRRLLLAHPMVLPEPSRVRFVGFGAYSLDLEMFAYIATTDWDEFLEVREDILLRVMDVVSASGTGFAFPSQTTYFSRDDGLDPERGRKAEEEVEAWRKESKLPFPRFDERLVSELRGTLDYPPRGSTVAVEPSK